MDNPADLTDEPTKVPKKFMTIDVQLKELIQIAIELSTVASQLSKKGDERDRNAVRDLCNRLAHLLLPDGITR